MHGVIERNPFGLLVAPGPPPLAAHIPFVLHKDEGRLGTLVAHTPRADPIARVFDGRTELLAVFQGPSAYIRSRWYVNPGLPTYNFFAVHAYGIAAPLSGDEAILAHLAELIDVHEEGYEDRFRLAETDDAYVAPLLEHISPFTLEIKRLEGKVKLNQNRAVADRQSVIGNLRERGAGDDRAVAEAMESYPYRSDEPEPLVGTAGGAPGASRDGSRTEQDNPLRADREGQRGRR